MNMWTSRKIMWTCYVIGMVVVIGSVFLKNDMMTKIFGALGLLIIVGGYLFMRGKWKCPNCGRNLPAFELGIERCPYCRSKLR